jgi:hypothetical protein
VALGFELRGVFLLGRHSPLEPSKIVLKLLKWELRIQDSKVNYCPSGYKTAYFLMSIKT